MIFVQGCQELRRLFWTRFAVTREPKGPHLVPSLLRNQEACRKKCWVAAPARFAMLPGLSNVVPRRMLTTLQDDVSASSLVLLTTSGGLSSWAKQVWYKNSSCYSKPGRKSSQVGEYAFLRSQLESCKVHGSLGKDVSGELTAIHVWNRVSILYAHGILLC